MCIEEQIGDILVSKNYTISTSESCTGGMVAAKLINYPGISKVFNEGFITYSNEAKIKHLGVREDSLIKFGAVSEQVASEMAIGVAKNTNSNIGLSTTGIAGPGGGTAEKPVGLVYIGIYYNNEVYVEKLNLSGDRNNVRENTVNAILKKLLFLLKK